MNIDNGNNVFEIPECLSAKDIKSFAYVTVKDRLPVILTKVVDLLFRSRHAIAATYGEASRDQNKEIVGRLSKLRNEMQTNKALIPIVSKSPDVTLWNSYHDRYVETEGKLPYWFEASWLYVECYLYRRIREAFELSTLLQNFDPFRDQKEAALIASMDAISTLANFLVSTVKTNGKNSSTIALKESFLKLLEVTLWGNKCDLSISSGAQNAQTVSPIAQLDTLRDNILVNHSEDIWYILQAASRDNSGQVVLHLVLDNAGYELFTDFCLAHFLQEVGLVSKVHFFVKEMPWFVSDTMASDLEWSLRYLCRHESPVVSDLASRWTERFNSGEWVVERDQFWTLPYDYSEMATFGAGLYKKLSSSHLVLFKGDLNYRKLTGDRKWDTTTPFATSLCGFAAAPLAVLRTLKADVVVGLQPGQAQKIEKMKSNWMISGDFAVIQCSSSFP